MRELCLPPVSSRRRAPGTSTSPAAIHLRSHQFWRSRRLAQPRRGTAVAMSGDITASSAITSAEGIRRPLLVDPQSSSLSMDAAKNSTWRTSCSRVTLNFTLTTTGHGADREVFDVPGSRRAHPVARHRGRSRPHQPGRARPVRPAPECCGARTSPPRACRHRQRGKPAPRAQSHAGCHFRAASSRAE